MLGWLSKMFGRRDSAPKGRGQSIRARYDAAQTTDDNAPLWQLTDFLSAKAANNYQTRRTLKIRSRYEAANNSYFRGIIDTLANDLIGTGPRLQVGMPGPAAKAIEARWGEWCEEIGFTEKLHLLEKAKIQDGEGFGLHVTNRKLEAVQLDLQVIESDQVMTPDSTFTDPYWVDGVVLDKQGNPKEYHVLRQHPGDLYFAMLSPLDYGKWKPRDVCHWFRKDRPGQVRGIPEITPALELFGKLRRFTQAVLAAAETAADYSAVVESTAAAETNDLVEPWDTISIERDSMVTMPAGWRMNQFKPEQPATTFEMFERLLLRQIARCLKMPLNVALGDSSGYNYSSGRLDHLGYHRQQRVDRGGCTAAVLTKTYVAWYYEAIRIPDYLPAGLPLIAPPRRWFWDSAESIDPVKDANADAINLANRTTSLATLYAEQGEDWEAALQQIGREQALLKQLGLTVEQVAEPAQRPKKPVSAGRRNRGLANA